MPNTKSLSLSFAAALSLTGALLGCRPTSHAVAPAHLGVVRSTADLEAVLEEPGPVSVETVTGADWEVARSGLINLDHPTARAAKLTDDPEPIHIYFHAIRHPRRGLYLVDTGVERSRPIPIGRRSGAWSPAS